MGHRQDLADKLIRRPCKKSPQSPAVDFSCLSVVAQHAGACNPRSPGYACTGLHLESGTSYAGQNWDCYTHTLERRARSSGVDTSAVRHRPNLRIDRKPASRACHAPPSATEHAPNTTARVRPCVGSPRSGHACSSSRMQGNQREVSDSRRGRRRRPAVSNGPRCSMIEPARISTQGRLRTEDANTQSFCLRVHRGNGRTPSRHRRNGVTSELWRQQRAQRIQRVLRAGSRPRFYADCILNAGLREWYVTSNDAREAYMIQSHRSTRSRVRVDQVQPAGTGFPRGGSIPKPMRTRLVGRPRRCCSSLTFTSPRRMEAEECAERGQCLPDRLIQPARTDAESRRDAAHMYH